MNKKSLIAGIALALVSIIAVVAAALFLTSSGTSNEQSAEASQQAAPVPQRPDCPSHGIGGIDLECLGGNAGQRPQNEGVVIANVWAWWCGPCREELPLLEQYSQAHPEHQVVGVHADKAAGNGAAFLNDLGVGLPSYQDNDNRFAGSLGLPSVVPITVVFVDGEPVARIPVAFESVEQIESKVAEALAGRS
ncbi:TlpA family protein disulfide reductase [Corynebacterium tapiri]|uniref:Redoxin domain-containing protein n=1 Tax=Corynebacterium tapiri TaxID=1448266 RepID=A0A5C4U369_9CORY|nr:TlpA disulfide reductase family protein [Corynebacterium tapiri]TNL97357.1 redoxin domain-containing protein [Corynebacterium tapiri]